MMFIGLPHRLTTYAFCVIVIFLLSAHSGCSEVVRKVTQRPWHAKYDWNAEDFFDDPQVIALCHAIEANDLEKIDLLVAEGTDVNAQGKGKMTPLLWAYPDNKLDGKRTGKGDKSN